MENRWVDWGCHNKEILQGKKKKKSYLGKPVKSTIHVKTPTLSGHNLELANCQVII